MGDVGEGAAVDEGGRGFEGLDEVGHQGVAEQGGHGAGGVEVGGGDEGAVPPAADDHAAEAGLEVVEAGGEAEDGHDFGGDGDVEAVFAGAAVGGAAEAVDDLAEGAVVHVERAAPGDAPGVDTVLVGRAVACQ